MVRLTRFEDIEAWKKARDLTKTIYQVTSVGEFARDFCLRDQIRRAAISIMSNIAEGFERKRTNEFCYFLSVAKGSVGEVKAQIYVAMDAGLISEAQFEQLYKSATETGQLIGGFIKYLNQLKIKSPKSKPMPNP
ncbi:MAG: four helix bundle protein [Bacillota bacterium]